jgi:hypothetical protein
MERRILRVAGQAPKVRWKRNVGRKKRTVEEAVTIAREHGVQIPDDVLFVEAEPGDLKGSLKQLFAGGDMETARGPDVRERPDGYIYWVDHYHRITGKIPFRIHPEVLTGDECIVAVFQHEMSEWARLRRVFDSSDFKRMNATDYGLQVATGRAANFHDLAWDDADEAVLRMRKAKPC